MSLDYATYLRLPELLALQLPRSDHPDELHFIVTHQAIELSFKVLAGDLRRARRLIDADDLAGATVLMRRACALVAVTAAQIGTLEHLPPQSFHRFRPYLGTASGLESVQFRELEILSGLRSEGYLARLRQVYGDGLPGSLQRALAEESLADAHRAAGARRGVTRWADFCADPHRDPLLDLLTTALIDYDDAWRQWRSQHLAVVLRMLGAAAPGTAGTSSAYLTRRVYVRFFPYLWEARSEYTLRVAGQLNPVINPLGPSRTLDLETR